MNAILPLRHMVCFMIKKNLLYFLRCHSYPRCLAYRICVRSFFFIFEIFQGLLRASKKYIDTRNSMLRLWIHEGLRVFYDRLVDEKDRATYLDLVGESLASYFDQTYHGLCPSKQSPIFVDFMNPDNSYEDVTDLDRLRKFMAQTLKEYNESPGMVHVDLVMFRDAIEHSKCIY